MSDRNFDDLANRFAQNIYNHSKGEIRLRLVQEELLLACPQLKNGKPLRILDAGCGMGQMTAMLSALGHHVVCCDLSAAMLTATKDAVGKDSVGKTHESMHAPEPIRFIQCAVQDLDQHLIDESFDLIVFHAVLEWMEEPQQGLQSLLKWLKPGGTLSMMFYNIHSLIFKNLLRGNFQKIEERNFRGDPGSLTPINPLDPLDVEQWLATFGLTVFSKRGIRTFYDYMDMNMKPSKQKKQSNKNEPSIEDVIRLEKQYSTLEPYRSLSRYLLLHAKNKY